MKIRVLIVDDEPLSRRGVAIRLREHADMQVIGECENGELAIQFISELKPDLVFLDVQMPGITGIDVLKGLPIVAIPSIVFLTAHDDYAVAAFEVQALDYLLKPIDDDRFSTALNRVRRQLALEQQEALHGRLHELLQMHAEDRGPVAVARFAVRSGNQVAFVDVDSIDWIEAMGDYAGLHVASRTHLLRESLRSLEGRLDDQQFLRIHRSAIVRIDRIMRMDPLENRDCRLTLRDGTALRMSRNYSKPLRDILRNRV